VSIKFYKSIKHRSMNKE